MDGTTVTLEQLHHEIIGVRHEVAHLRTLIAEEYELADDLVEDIEASRSRSDDEFVLHDDLRREFG